MAKAAVEFDERIRNVQHMQSGGSEPQFPPCFVINVGAEEWAIPCTYGNYVIPARPDGKRFAAMKIEQRRDANDMGDGRKSPAWISATDIALDLVQRVGPRFGLFVCSGPNPGDKDLKAAETELTSYLKELVVEANNVWSRSRNSNLISDMQRRAAKELGLAFDWIFDPTQMADCKYCGGKVKPNVAVCMHCGGILNRELAREGGLVDDEPRHTAKTKANGTE